MANLRSIAEADSIGLLRIENLASLGVRHGPGAASLVLRTIEARLAPWAFPPRPADIRVAEDEIIILLPASVAGQDAALKDAAALLRAASAPLTWREASLPVRLTLGIAPPQSPDVPLETSLFAARIALAATSSSPGGEIRICSQDELAYAIRRCGLEADLPGAIASGQIVPYYQPIVDLQTGRIAGLEVLARWRHPVDGLLGPDLFIPMAESLGLCCDLTISLMAQAAADSRAWPRSWRYAFNISPSELSTLMNIVAQPDLMRERVRAPRLIELEVTETALVQDPLLLQRVIAAVQPMGVSVALDDFGTGYANFQHLRTVPFGRLKVDKSFVAHMLEDRRARECTRAIVGLAHCLGMSATAEGVESPEAARALAQMGCDHAQGYFFSRPQPAEVIHYLADGTLGEDAPPLWTPGEPEPLHCAAAAD